MTRIRIITMALAAVFCLSAVVASSALAVAKKGEIVNKSGAALVKKGFTGKGGEQLLETTAGVKVTCKKGTATGTVLSKTSGTQTVAFAECKNSLGQKCKGGNAGTTGAEEIKIGGVKVSPGFTPGSAKGTLLLASTISLFSFKCSEINQEVKNGFLAPVGEAQESKLKTTFSFTATGEKGIQTQTEYENLAGTTSKLVLESNLAGEGFKQSDQTGTEEVTFEEEAELI